MVKDFLSVLKAMPVELVRAIKGDVAAVEFEDEAGSGAGSLGLQLRRTRGLCDLVNRTIGVPLHVEVTMGIESPLAAS